MSAQLKSHQYLYTQYVQCLFNMGRFREVLERSEEYLVTELPVDESQVEYNRAHFAQCVASYCTQSAYETNDRWQFEKWLKLVSDPEKSIFMVLKCIKD